MESDCGKYIRQIPVTSAMENKNSNIKHNNNNIYKHLPYSCLEVQECDLY